MTNGSRTSSVAIGALLPDVLGTYADRGNATVLAQRLRWRGIPAEVVEVTADRTAPTTCDIYLIGGGEDTAQSFSAGWVNRQRALVAALERAQVVAVCAGFQILGRWVSSPDGHRIHGAGLLDVTTSPGRRRAVGEVVTESSLPELGRLTGFENHRGLTRLGPGVRPLGRVLHGTGNGRDTEGVLTPNVVATYLHGPVLARNPALADFVLGRALGVDRLPALEVDDETEARAAHLSADARRLRRPRILDRLSGR